MNQKSAEYIAAAIEDLCSGIAYHAAVGDIDPAGETAARIVLLLSAALHINKTGPADIWAAMDGYTAGLKG